jgi:hypothetical protein
MWRQSRFEDDLELLAELIWKETVVADQNALRSTTFLNNQLETVGKICYVSRTGIRAFWLSVR